MTTIGPPTATTRLVHVNEQLREFIRETQLPAYKARHLAEIITDITDIIPLIDAEVRCVRESARAVGFNPDDTTAEARFYRAAGITEVEHAQLLDRLFSRCPRLPHE